MSVKSEIQLEKNHKSNVSFQSVEKRSTIIQNTEANVYTGKDIMRAK